MSIVLELQQEALKSNSDILSLLRKAYLVARKLGLNDFYEWINNELNGYTNREKIPSYRSVRGELKALNPYNNGWISVVAPDNELETVFNTKKIFDSIPSLNSLLISKEKYLAIPINASQVALLNKFTEFETTYKLIISPNVVNNIIEQVKNSILDWAIVLEENAIMGEGLRFTQEEKTKAQTEPQIINYINNFYGDVSDSKIQQGTKNSEQNS